MRSERLAMVEPTDERVDLMRAFVDLDRERDFLSQQRRDLDENFERVSQKRAAMLEKLSDVLGLSGMNAKAPR